MTSPESFNNSPVLALNCTESLLQVVIGSHRGVLFSQEISCPGNAMPHMVPAIADGLKTLGLKPADLAGLACVRGPGSFTGIRMALATIQGLARGSGLPVAGIEYLPLVAAGALPLHDGEVWAVTYARRNQVYVQGFLAPSGTPIGTAEALPVTEAAAMLGKRPAGRVLIGSGVRLNRELLEQEVTGATLLHGPTFEFPSPGALLTAALNSPFSTAPLRPIYIRKSDAEHNLDSIAKKRGIDVNEARKAIPDFESSEPSET